MPHVHHWIIESEPREDGYHGRCKTCHEAKVHKRQHAPYFNSNPELAAGALRAAARVREAMMEQEES